MLKVKFKVKHIQKMLHRLDMKKFCGLDEISGMALKNCALQLDPISLVSIKFPMKMVFSQLDLKTVRVQPVLKFHSTWKSTNLFMINSINFDNKGQQRMHYRLLLTSGNNLLNSIKILKSTVVYQ